MKLEDLKYAISKNLSTSYVGVLIVFYSENISNC
jgi:hypothetical protein